MHVETVDVADAPELGFNERLRMEMGWTEVAKGLSQVLFGYLTLFLGTSVGFGLVALALWGLGEAAGKKGAKVSNAVLWELYLGLGILSVIGLISYIIIVGGQFKCMMYAAERHGARWFMFLAIACLFLGPAFETASGIASWQAVQELKKNPGKFQDFHLNPLGQWLHLIGFCISMLYPLCFTLFLRAIAVCLRANIPVMVVNIFLVLATCLVAATGYTLYKHPAGGPTIPLQQAVLVGAGWGVVLLLYVGVICMIRVIIYGVMAQVRSPLEVQTE
ncbi:MAG TPA: hypothetical protein VE988_08600 [Gemmataceae bacterium]|nr:hypothetical protein [Gemmataceae bacterium]